MYDYHLYSLRADYGIKPIFTYFSRLPKQGFSSLYQVTEETAKAIEQEGSTRWFKGVVWSAFLIIDVDSYTAAERTESLLIQKGLQYDAYDSGGRGAHFYIPRDAFPSHLLPLRDKQYVRANFPEADTSIYTHLHPFRLPGTIHSGTGRKKELVSSKTGSTIILPPFKEQDMQASASSPASGISSIFDCYRIMAKTVPVESGNRHHNMISLLYALKENGYDKTIAQFWVGEWNKLLEESKNEEDIEKAIKSIYG